MSSDATKATEGQREDNSSLHCPSNYCRRYYDSHMLHWRKSIRSSQTTSSRLPNINLSSAGQTLNIINIPTDTVRDSLKIARNCKISGVISVARATAVSQTLRPGTRFNVSDRLCYSTNSGLHNLACAKNKLVVSLKSRPTESTPTGETRCSQAAPHWSTKHISKLLFNRSLPAEQRYQRYIGHINKIDDVEDAETTMVGGFRLITAYHKPSISLPQLSIGDAMD